MHPRHPDRTDESVAEFHHEPLERSKLAILIANGELPFPDGLAPADRRRLAELVRSRRRTQLVQFLARQVAQHLRDHPPD